MSKDTGGQAFPCEQGHTPDGEWNQSFEPGMTLRDYFAGQVIASTAMALNGNHHVDQADRADRLAKQAYLLEDALLKAREVRP